MARQVSGAPSSPERVRGADGGYQEESDLECQQPKRRRLRQSGYDAPTRTTRRKTACQSCRMRKVKCDGARPVCAICSASTTSCVYTDPLPEKLSLESATDLLSRKIGQLQDSVDRLHAVHPVRSGVKDLVLNGSHVASLRPQLSDAESHHCANTTSVEPSKDFLQIPPPRTSADSVLCWDIFEGHYAELSLVGAFFDASTRLPLHCASSDDDEVFSVKGGLLPSDEERLPSLIDIFLQNVHTKNPILDVEQLVQHARMAATEGLTWNSWSCMILLAAALGVITKPFEASVITSPAAVESSPRFVADMTTTREELQQGESYFVLACRRLGVMKPSVIGVQCYFFAGVYLMYTMRPLLSWQYFIQASTLYQLYMKTKYGLTADMSGLSRQSSNINELADAKRRRIEESLYWSCFKSECEFRVELPLPQSEISTYHHPNLFPSPPSPPNLPESEALLQQQHSILSDTATSPTTITKNNEYTGLRQHAKRLCNEEESWYYYLTEIALRRIGNRIVNTFFGQDPRAWLNIRPLLGIALEFDTQVSSWSAHLPSAMQHWETTYTIRAPNMCDLPDGRANHVSRELSWATENRLLEMRSWLYRPFIYYLIHSDALPPHPLSCLQPATSSPAETLTRTLSPPDPPLIGTLDADDSAALLQFITSGIDVSLQILDVRSLRHRHHGLWYDMRSLMSASVVLLAIVKSGHEGWIPGGVEALWGVASRSSASEEQAMAAGRGEREAAGIGGKIGHVIDEFEAWSPESPDLLRHISVLTELTVKVRQLRAARLAA